MKPIAIRSNKTRAQQRPPLIVTLANPALLAALGFKKTHPAPRSTARNTAPRRKRDSEPAKPKPGATKPLTVDKYHQATPPVVKRPAPAAHRPVAEKPRAVDKPPIAEQPPAQAQAQAQPESKEQPRTRKLPPGGPPQVRKFHFGAQPGRLPASQNRFSGQQRTHKPGNLPAQKPAEPDGLPSNGKEPRLPHPNEDSAPRAPGANGVNGTNGAVQRTSLFRPGAFANLPVLRIPPKASSSVQKPPVQIPMEVYNHPEKDDVAPPENNKPAVPLTPPARLVPLEPASKVSGLDQLIKQNPGLPAHAAVLGVCEDGLPVLLDLNDPAPGALVVIGDEREAQLEILRTAVTSIAGRNSPRSVQFIVFSCEPGAWQDWVREKGFDRHCLAIESSDGEMVRDWIVRLADWTEQRRLGQANGPSLLLVMDTLNFLPALNYDIRLNFEWMAKEGPQAQIWPLAVISTDLARALSVRRMLRAFQTRVIGYADQTEDYIALAGLNQQEMQDFGQRGEFMVKAGDAWLRFRLPGC